TTQQVIREKMDLDRLLSRALELSDYAVKKKRFAVENKPGPRKKGIGIASFLHGAGFTGSGERYLNSLVGVDINAEGNVRVLVSSAEFGQEPTRCSARLLPKRSASHMKMFPSHNQTRRSYRTVARQSHHVRR